MRPSQSSGFGPDRCREVTEARLPRAGGNSIVAAPLSALQTLDDSTAMTALELLSEPVTAHVPGTLAELQLRVARRADELARRTRADRHADRRLWLRAELEIFERMEQVKPRNVS